ncbi:MAG: hypothetical protein JWO38_4125 [Gemmataceae bacterium]|nr:hypothetical protein [Gemmataceae bacterium]
MPLYDHFHGLLAATHHLESFHTRWGVAMADDLNRRLPKRFLAEAPMHLGSAVAADVAETDQLIAGEFVNGSAGHGPLEDGGGVALATESYAPPATALSMPATFPNEMRVEIRDSTRAYQVVGVVELVSPGNKTELSEREQFAAKCLSYLGKGIGLVVIDIVTERLANVHNVVVRLAGHDPKFEMAGDPPTYAVAYRPVRRNKENLIDLWHWPLAVGTPLPIVPLALKGFGCVALDLEATYAEACERSRIP